MLDYLKRFLIAGIMAICVSLLFFGGKPQAQNIELTADWIWPTDGVISDTYGTRLGHHKGIDIAAGLNTPIFTVDDGIVTKSYYSDTYGHVIFIKHSNNLETVYAHLNNREVDEGNHVKKGDIIGRMGSTGRSSGVHLHFEVHQNEWTFEKENAVNPSFVLGNMEIGKIVQAFTDDNAQFVVKNIEPLHTEHIDKEENHEQSNSTVHIVKPGETLWSIAQVYSTTIENLKRDNSLTTEQIFEKQTIKVPLVEKNSYIVQNGDTLSAISLKTNLSVEELRRFNQLTTDEIYPLQIINIPINK
jgi:LysM repeat protein